MYHKVIVVKERLGHLRMGMILNNAILNKDGYWEGIVVDGPASWLDRAPDSICEIWDQEKHDPVGFIIKEHFRKEAEKERLSPVLDHMCKQLTKE